MKEQNKATKPLLIAIWYADKFKTGLLLDYPTNRSDLNYERGSGRMEIRQIELKAEIAPLLKRRLALHRTAACGQVIDIAVANKDTILGQACGE